MSAIALRFVEALPKITEEGFRKRFNQAVILNPDIYSTLWWEEEYLKISKISKIKLENITKMLLQKVMLCCYGLADLYYVRAMTATNRIQLLPIISPLIAIASSLVVGAILIILAGANPITAYGALFQESLSTYFGFGNTLTKMTPLLLTSLGVLVALRAGQFNIGGEGQIYLGALGSALIGCMCKIYPHSFTYL
jgi:hypothetical protein